ncbi:hypothetical protein N7517_004716 [Penicillium concentricum]|uniref:Uncharacterized protein n=1 Tax=Penicillium concentricum TaxID=293559 RepID=A0A9W9S6D3_9EURO|nr:uncharacterized protein N7517_004716 [Penicillium concentricum]KAJ5372710.1 hypothetical protein N7517_004716 [Penicillium concentricum]
MRTPRLNHEAEKEKAAAYRPIPSPDNTELEDLMRLRYRSTRRAYRRTSKLQDARGVMRSVACYGRGSTCKWSSSTRLPGRHPVATRTAGGGLLQQMLDLRGQELIDRRRERAIWTHVAYRMSRGCIGGSSRWTQRQMF